MYTVIPGSLIQPTEDYLTNVPSEKIKENDIMLAQAEAKRRLRIFRKAFGDGRELEAESSLGDDDLAIPVIAAYIDILEAGEEKAMAWLDERLAAMVAAGECRYSVPFPGSMTVAEVGNALRMLAGGK